MNTLFSASGYRIAMKICKDCVLEIYETVEKFDNYTKNSRKLRDFEIGPLFVNIIEKLYVRNVDRILSCHVKLLH